mgnify:CR=1 FL=1
MLSEPPPPLLRVLTVNVHKEAAAAPPFHAARIARSRTRGAQRLVFLQEVSGPGARDPMPRAWRNGVQGAHCEYLADEIWSEHAYGRNAAVIDGLDHGECAAVAFSDHRLHQSRCRSPVTSRAGCCIAC